MMKMKKLTMIAILVAFIASCTLGCAPVYVEKTPPPVKVEIKSPKPGLKYIWAPGHWKHTRHGYVWVPGHWKKRNKNKHWVNGRWKHTPRGWVWIPGHWSR